MHHITCLYNRSRAGGGTICLNGVQLENPGCSPTRVHASAPKLNEVARHRQGSEILELLPGRSVGELLRIFQKRLAAAIAVPCRPHVS